MSPIKDFYLTYESINKEDTSSQGDAVTGTVFFTLTKETRVESLVVETKGEAHVVHWTKGSGDHKRFLTAHREYFTEKEDLIYENASGGQTGSDGLLTA